jgi:hypothetical protein
MRHLIIAGVLPTLLLSALPAQAQMVTITPEQIGQIFCIGSLGNDMAPVEALLTPDLAKTIDEALDRSDAIQAEHPDEKPPLGDGVPWRTWPDYADGCTVASAVTEGETATVTIAYTFAEYPEADYSNDLLLQSVVVQQGFDPFWRIDDVDLGEGRTLRSTLAGAFVP